MKLDILFEDTDIVVVNKPAPLLFHPERKGQREATLLKQLRDQVNCYLYPIHRLDRQVSGAALFGKNKEVIRELSPYWNTSSVRKFYTGLVRGTIESSGKFNFPLLDDNKNPKESITIFHPLEVYERSSLVEIEILTGRKHQIRRHFSRRCHHIIGDRKYGKKNINDFYKNHFKVERVFLHSHRLDFYHPNLNKIISVKAPLPQELRNSLSLLRSSTKSLTT